MNRYLYLSEYRHTPRGLVGLFNYRRVNKHKWLTLDIEPRINKRTAKKIRAEIIQTKKTKKWHRINADISVEIMFQVSERNQTSLYKLTKFLIDLLHKDERTYDDYKSLLFTDDKQIKCLDVKLLKGDSSRISIDITSMSNLKEELELVNYTTNHFEIDENADYTVIRDSDRDIDYNWFSENGLITDGQLDTLRNLQRSNRRNELLNLISANNSQEVSGLYNYLSGNFTITDVPVTSLFFGQRISFVPTREGDVEKYKTELKDKLDNYWNGLNNQMSFNYPIDLNLYYIPPITGGRDIDNFAYDILTNASNVFQFSNQKKFSGYRIITLPKNSNYPNGLLVFTFGIAEEILSNCMHRIMDHLEDIRD